MTNGAAGSRVYGGVTGAVAGVVITSEARPATDEARLAALFEAHHVRLYRLARRLVATPDEARDLVQDAFLRAVRAPASVPAGTTAEEAWLVRVLVNLCRDRWRRAATRKRFEAANHAESRAVISSDPEAVFVAQTTIWRALRELAPRRRAVLVLHELEGASVADVAALLGVAAVTVRWHLSMGRRELARAVREREGVTT